MEACEAGVIVVGTGPAGIGAASSAAEVGAQVLIVDDNFGTGGQIWRGQTAETNIWVRRLRGSGIEMLPGAQVIAADRAARTLLVETPTDALQLRFEKLVLATGARELFLPFPGWTLPGVMGVGGLQALVKSGLPIGGKRIVVAGSGPLLLAVAAYLRKSAARVILIAEQARRSALAGFMAGLAAHPAKLVRAAALQCSLAGVSYRFGCWIERAEGEAHIESVWIRQGNRTWTEKCDFAAVAYGLYPNVELASLLGCAMRAHAVIVNERQESSINGIFAAGECTGIGGVDLALVEGQIAGYAAADREDRARDLFRKRRSARRFAEALNRAFALRPELKSLVKPETFVCRCEDVSFARLQEHKSFRAAKLHTRCGMGSCQGRICGPATRFLFGWEEESIRPPIFPASVRSLIGRDSMEEEELPAK